MPGMAPGLERLASLSAVSTSNFSSVSSVAGTIRITESPSPWPRKKVLSSAVQQAQSLPSRCHMLAYDLGHPKPGKTSISTKPTKVLWLFAHPEYRSLSAALRNEGLRMLTEDGHKYELSDLYALGWNPIVDGADFGHDDLSRLLVASASREAYGWLSADIRAEQAKLTWADTVIVQFPFWWFGMPAILKGYFDRVFVRGFVYGVKDCRNGRTLRCGNGGLVGKRAMVITTVGEAEHQIGPRGIDGDMGDMLYPLQHGTLFYSGMTVVPPLVVASANRMAEKNYPALLTALRNRLRTLLTTEPIPFRSQDGRDYDDRGFE